MPEINSIHDAVYIINDKVMGARRDIQSGWDLDIRGSSIDFYKTLGCILSTDKNISYGVSAKRDFRPVENTNVSFVSTFRLEGGNGFYITFYGTDLKEVLTVNQKEGFFHANGKRLDLLSKQELNVYLIDEFVITINSDGLENYFAYCAQHFIGLCSALEQIGCTEAQELWNKIKDKISKVPINDPKFEKALLQVADRDVNFENEEAFYYKKVEKKLLSKLSQYVLKNTEFFQ